MEFLGSMILGCFHKLFTMEGGWKLVGLRQMVVIDMGPVPVVSFN